MCVSGGEGGDEEAFTEMNSSVCREFCGAGMTLILGTPICLWCHSFYFLTAVLYSCSFACVYVLLYPCNDTRRIYGNCYDFVQQILGFEEKSKRSALDSYDSLKVK